MPVIRPVSAAGMPPENFRPRQSPPSPSSDVTEVHAGIPKDGPGHRRLAERWARIADIRPMRRGEVLFREGDDVSAVYRVARGRLDISARDTSGRTDVRWHVGGGEYLIELALDGKHMTRASCAAAGKLQWIPVSRFYRLVEQDGYFAMMLCRALAENIAELRQVRELCERHTGTVRDRILKYVVAHADPATGELELPFSQGDWARELGTAGETLSRVLGQMMADKDLERIAHRNFRLLRRS